MSFTDFLRKTNSVRVGKWGVKEMHQRASLYYLHKFN